METTESIANFFIDKASLVACEDLSQLKMQKLVYYAHGWFLGLGGGPLFLEPVQAWRYGPVIESLRREFRAWGANPIRKKARGLSWKNGELVEHDFPLSDSERVSPFLSRIWDEYHLFTAIQLTNMTHEPGTPWHQIATHYQFQIPPGITIPNELIQNYFQQQARAKPQESASPVLI